MIDDGGTVWTERHPERLAYLKAAVTMTREVAARLAWRICRPEGSGYPRGERFATPARFEHQGEDWIKDAWSVVVSASNPVAVDATQSVRVRFLMDGAPHGWLVSGKRFELYEGRLLLAEGVIE